MMQSSKTFVGGILMDVAIHDDALAEVAFRHVAFTCARCSLALGETMDNDARLVVVSGDRSFAITDTLKRISSSREQIQTGFCGDGFATWGASPIRDITVDFGFAEFVIRFDDRQQ